MINNLTYKAQKNKKEQKIKQNTIIKEKIKETKPINQKEEQMKLQIE